MGFFGRLGNLGKGWLSSKRSSVDTSVVDAEIQHDRLNPTPGPEAQAELDALKKAAGQPVSTKEKPSGDDSSGDTSAPDEPPDEDAPVKKTL